MAAPRAPRSIKAATEMLERYAVLEGDIGAVEADRGAQLSAINAASDTVAEPLLKERDELRGKLEKWWAGAAEELTEGKRKSIELGGCVVGTRAGKESLKLLGPEKDVVAVLSALRWAKPLLRTKTTLDRKAVLMSLGGGHGLALAELGLLRGGGQETFYVQRTEQSGTLASR